MARRFSELLRSPLEVWTIEYRVHATQRMFKRSINDGDVKRLLASGIIIEEYPGDYPFPSALIYGVAHDNRPLHAVVGIDCELRRLYLITIYEPDPDKWSEDFDRRK